MRVRGIDPIFAISIGIAAAAVRINREEKEKGKSTPETIESFKRRWALMSRSTDTAKKEDMAGP